ncbi:MAG: efflux RND transporter permease subunit, partial [Rhizobiales bacterium]|nr:efflux RND transporter permease subunit [Hyphomicrobiales bacterium]
AGASIITLQFNLSVPLDVAEQEVQAALNAAGNLLPSDLPAPPIYAKVNPADAPVLTLALTSKTMPLRDVQALADTRLAQKISQLPGVGLVRVSGGQRPAVRVRADSRRLAAHGLNIDDLRTTLGNANVNTPKGSFDGPARAQTINANDQMQSAAQFEQVIVAYRNGAPVRLRDVATVVDGVENDKLAAWMNDVPAIILNVQRQPGANVIDVVDRVNALLPALRTSLPSSIDIAVLTDRTVTIRASVRDVGYELTLAVILVILVIFVFLRSARATLIPSLSVPLSLVGTLGVMYLFGYSLNNLSLMALTIATGFVVDDAIVVIENIARYLEEGYPPIEAALKGSEQIAFTIISLTISLVAVMIPLLFMSDIVGRLFREFAVTLSTTILVSGLVSLTLVPMACGKLLRPLREADENVWQRASRRMFDAVLRPYGRALDFVLDHQSATLAVFLGTLVATGALYVVIPKGFFPQQDTGVIQAVTEGAQSVSFKRLGELQQELGRVIVSDPDVASLSSFIGVDGSNATPNVGRMLINLKPHGQRKNSIDTVMARLRRAADALPGITIYMQPVQDLTIDGSVSRTEYQFTLQSANSDDLAEWTPRLIARLSELPELAHVASDMSQKGLAVRI